MFSKKLKISLLSGAVAAIAAVLPMQQANATVGQLPACIGTYKCGMAGAGLSIASDPTAAAINPALIGRMDNSAIISMGWFHADVERDLTGTYANTAGGKQKSNTDDFVNGSLGVNYRLDDNYAVNLSVYPGGGGATNWTNSRTGAGTSTSADRKINWKMFNAQLGVAYTPNTMSSYGLGLVLGYATMRTDSKDNQFNVDGNWAKDTAKGAGFQLGGQWQLNDDISVAADYHSKVWFERFKKYTSTFNSTVDRPETYSAGIAWKVQPATTLALDFKHVNEGSVDTISNPSAQGCNVKECGGFGWTNINMIMVGVEHDATDDLTVRAGYSYNNSPIDNEAVFANVLFPAIVEQHFTAGLTYAVMDGMELGISGYVTPTKRQRESGAGDAFSTGMAGSTLWHRQYGSQVSLKYDF